MFRRWIPLAIEVGLATVSGVRPEVGLTSIENTTKIQSKLSQRTDKQIIVDKNVIENQGFCAKKWV